MVVASHAGSIPVELGGELGYAAGSELAAERCTESEDGAMPIGRVLILHSFKHQGAYDAVLREIEADPRLKEIAFRHCCVVDKDRKSDRIQTMDSLADQRKWDEANDILAEVVKEEVGPLMDQQISEFNPDVVIVQGGTVFEAATGACLTMLIRLLEKHPDARLALQGKREWLARISGKDHHPFKRRTVKNQIRWVRQNLVDDEAVDEIIAALFGQEG